MFREAVNRIPIYLMTLGAYLLIATAGCLAQEAEQTFEKLPIGKKDGLRLTADIHRQRYKPNDELVITLKFENLTERNLYISKHQLGNSGAFVGYGFALKNSVISVARKGVDPRKKYKAPPKPQLSLSDFVLIVPKGSYDVDITVKLSDYIFLPGEYNLFIYHRSLWSQKEVPEIEGLWGSEHGVLYSIDMVNGTPITEPLLTVLIAN
jgi:hypothetical protein